jgi:hypothetical protein
MLKCEREFVLKRLGCKLNNKVETAVLALVRGLWVMYTFRVLSVYQSRICFSSMTAHFHVGVMV